MHTAAGKVTAVDFVSVPSFVLVDDVVVPTSLGPLHVAVGFGGAIYAQADAAAAGLTVTPDRHLELIALGREVKQALEGTAYSAHPTDDRLGGVYGTILYEDLGDGPQGRATSATSRSSPTASSTAPPAAPAPPPASPP